MAESKLDKFYDLVEKIEIAMLTTRRTDGLLVTRPMATQARSQGADLWFVTATGSPKLAEIRHDPQVNVGYFRDRTKEWVSVSGTARIVDDRQKIHELYRPDWRAWFGDDGGEKDGTPDDPRIVLIAVDVQLAMYLEVNKPAPVVLFDLVKGIITGNRPDLGKTEIVRGEELRGQ